MPTLHFTQDAVESLRAPTSGRAYYWDENNPGFGLRITSKNRRVWIAMYRVHGKQIMETLGTTFEIPSLKDARTLAGQSKFAARKGVNVVAQKREERAAAKKAALTFGDAAERYLVEYVERNCRPNTIRETRRVLKHDVLPIWGSRPLAEITKADVRALLVKKATTRDRPRTGFTKGAEVQSNRVLARLKTLFRWCHREMDLIEKDPTFGVKPLTKETSRDRFLDDQEIAAFWHGCDVLGYPYAPLLKLMLLTGQRRSEVAGTPWCEINLEKCLWTLPKERAKNEKQHLIHLSPLALEVIREVPRMGDLLFGTATNFAHNKTRLDAAMIDLHGSNVEKWTLHDLRRTLATGMIGIGVSPHVADKILNHTPKTLSGIALIYNRFQFLDERRDALDRWAAHVENLIKRIKPRVRRAVL